MHSIRKKNKKGFSLIELLIVSSLLVVVSCAIYATFNNGIRIWQKINEEVLQEDMDIFFEKFILDLRNAFRFTGLNFLGEGNRLEFITLVESPRMQKNTVGKVSYLYDSQSKIIEKYSSDFSQIYDGNPGLRQQLLTGAESLKFQYYFYDAATKEYFWLDEWKKESLPLAVRVELSLDEGGQKNEFVKTVSIPASD